jgi:hypothetical protein
MDLRYDGGDAGTPDLEVVDRTTSNGEPRSDYLCTLLVWDEKEAVDDPAWRCNDVIFLGRATVFRWWMTPSGCGSVWSDGSH